MKHNKSFYTSLPEINVYTWRGYWSNLHHFVKGNYYDGFYEIKCTDTDIENGNIYDMIKYEVSK